MQQAWQFNWYELICQSIKYDFFRFNRSAAPCLVCALKNQTCIIFMPKPNIKSTLNGLHSVFPAVNVMGSGRQCNASQGFHWADEWCAQSCCLCRLIMTGSPQEEKGKHKHNSNSSVLLVFVYCMSRPISFSFMTHFHRISELCTQKDMAHHLHAACHYREHLPCTQALHCFQLHSLGR